MLFGFQSCESSTDANLATYTKDTIDAMDNYEFPEGTYYKYDFSSLSETIEPVKEIDKFIEKGITLKQAWYRSPKNGCSPPGSDWVTTAMYSAVFIILLKNPDDEISDENYSKLIYEPSISCGYNVVTYMLKE